MKKKRNQWIVTKSALKCRAASNGWWTISLKNQDLWPPLRNLDYLSSSQVFKQLQSLPKIFSNNYLPYNAKKYKSSKDKQLRIEISSESQPKKLMEIKLHKVAL